MITIMNRTPTGGRDEEREERRNRRKVYTARDFTKRHI